MPNITVSPLVFPSSNTDPRLWLNARSLAGEVAVIVPLTFTAVGTLNTITVTFNRNVVLFGDGLVAAKWTVTGSGAAVTVTGVASLDNVVTLTTDEQQTGSVYTLHAPTVGVADEDGVYLESFTGTFTGVGVAPTLTGVSVENSTSILVTFSEPVNSTDATTAANYTFNHGLTAVSASQVTSSSYRVTTTSQLPTQSYTLTVNNIRDLKNNPV